MAASPSPSRPSFGDRSTRMMSVDTASIASSTVSNGSVKSSPERRFSGSFSMAGIGAKLGRILNNGRASNDYESTIVAGEQEPASPMGSRSRSRGRDFTFSGRGGAGNIRPTSQSHPRDGADDFNHPRGRDVAPPSHLLSSPTTTTTGLTHSGRGGAGNIRSPSRGPGTSPDAPRTEQAVVFVTPEKDSGLPHSSGRGGVGNIVSRSRSRSRDASLTRAGASGLHNSGRGGAGNIGLAGIGADGTIAEEEERRPYSQTEGLHSTGRGGVANIAYGQPPPVGGATAVYPSGNGNYSSGRGGAGNIRAASKTRSASRTRENAKAE